MVSSLPPWSYGGVLDTHIAPHRSLPSTWGFPSSAPPWGPGLYLPKPGSTGFTHETDLGMLHNLGWIISSINWFINQAKQSKSSWQVQLVPTSSEHTFTRQFLLCASLRGPVVRSDTYLPTHHSLVSRYWKQMQWSNLPAKWTWHKVSRYDFAVFYTKINIWLILYSPKKNSMSPFNSGNFVEFPGFPNRWELWSELLVQHQCTW